MAQITTRPATLADLETLLQFEQGVISSERPFDPTIKDDPTNYYDIKAMISAADVLLIVAETAGEIIGSGYARIEAAKVFLKHQQHAYLGFMFVKPEYRGRGVNRLIIEALRKWAAGQNIHELRLQVYDSNAPAVKAYEKVGFSKLLVEMRLGHE